MGATCGAIGQGRWWLLSSHIFEAREKKTIGKIIEINETDTAQLTGIKRSWNTSYLITEGKLTEVPSPHASPYHPASLNESSLLIARPYSPISHRVLSPPTSDNQVLPLLTSPEGITRVFPLLHETSLNTPTEDK